MTAATPSRRERWARTWAMALAIAEGDPAQVDEQMRKLGRSRLWLTPIAWMAGTLVLVIRGVALLIKNWRLALIQVVPAAVIWLSMYDLRIHALQGHALRHLSWKWIAVVYVAAIIGCIASFWCNTVFAYAIDTDPPRIGPAAHHAGRRWAPMVAAGALLGLMLATALTVVPRWDRPTLFSVLLLSVIGLLTVSFVALPAWILRRRVKRTPRQVVSQTSAGGLVSVVAMIPGFLVNRIGLLIMLIPGLAWLGFDLLSVGTAMYAAGMTSVKAVKLSIRLTDSDEPVH